MSLITCGSIHEAGHEWFSNDARGRRDLFYYVSNFADSRKAGIFCRLQVAG